MKQKISLFLLFIVIVITKIEATTIYVNYLAMGANDGTSWESAFVDLQIALQLATTSDSIWITKGSYLPTQNLDPTISFYIKPGISLFGGFAGYETSLSQRNILLNETILSGKLNSSIKSFHVLKIEYSDLMPTLDGFTIKDGQSPCDQLDCRGGGALLINTTALNTTSNITFKNIDFQYNGSTIYGGAVSINGGFSKTNIHFQYCSFSYNVSRNGGAIYYNSKSILGDSLFFENCNFNNNLAIQEGGAIYYIDSLNNSSAIKIDNCIFNYNGAGSGGGAVAIYANSNNTFTEINYSKFTNNSAGGDFDGLGGAIILGGKSAINSVLFYKNSAQIAGAYVGSVGNFYNCIFLDNYAQYYGGGIACSGKLKLLNCDFIKNRADFNGAAIFRTSNIMDTILNCIFNRNKIGNLPGAYYNSNPHVYCNYSIFDLPNCNSIYEISPVDSVICGPNILYNSTPNFRDSSHNDYRLTPCSIGINSGSDSLLISLNINTDFEGNSRFVDNIPDVGYLESLSYHIDSLVKDISCFGFGNGNITIQPVGGILPYSINWSDGGIGLQRFNLQVGIYTVDLIDSSGCQRSATFQINEPDLLVLHHQIQMPTSSVSTDGSIQLIIDGGTLPFHIYWNTGDTTLGINNVHSGLYYVHVTDAGNCTIFDSIFVDTLTLVVNPLDLSKFRISPIPASENLHIEFQSNVSQKIKLLSATGQILNEFDLDADEQRKDINIHLYPGGLYFIQWWQDGKLQLTKKFEVQH